MKRLTLAGFGRAEETATRTSLGRQPAEGWTLVEGSDADAVLLDLDSMYGQMAWLRGFAPGVVVIGLTRAARADTPYRLAPDFTPDELANLLTRVDDTAQETPPASIADAPPAEEAPAAVTPVADPGPRLATRLTTTGTPFRVRMGDLPDLVVDPVRDRFAPGRSLKALLGWATVAVPDEAVETLDEAEAAAALASAGDPQPLSRLRWLLALGAEDDAGPGMGADRRYALERWPQAEREFPKHFRIATVMMKRPGTVADIAAASGASEAEVADYIRAALAVGHIRAA